jgi:hypothetical protein
MHTHRLLNYHHPGAYREITKISHGGSVTWGHRAKGGQNDRLPYGSLDSLLYFPDAGIDNVHIFYVCCRWK